MTYIMKSKLGALLVATRHCFYYSDELRVYVRMRREGENLVRVEVCPTEQIQKLFCNGHAESNISYLLWNEDPVRGRKIIESIKFPARRFFQYASFVFNMQGEQIR